MNHWAEHEDDVLRREYASQDNAVIAQKVGRTPHAVYARAKILGLRKSREFMFSSRVRNIRIGKGFDAIPREQTASLVMRMPPALIELQCTTREQYAEWRRAAHVYAPSPEVGFCEDCTRDYQQKMKDEGRCARPEIRFFRRAATTWHVTDGHGKKRLVGMLNVERSNGEVYGAYQADNYSFTDVRSKQRILATDEQAT